MAASKAYLQDELSQKIPQKIISHFQITRNIGKDEQILAVFGGAQFMGITSSAVSTKNRLVYLNNAGIAPKQYVIHYADIESITTGSEKNREFKRVVLAVTVSLAKSHAVVQPASLYQPPKV
jgi:hypothetical protein